MEHECLEYNYNEEDAECEYSIIGNNSFGVTHWDIKNSCTDKRIYDIKYCPFCGVEL